jgi:hypothetical protein
MSVTITPIVNADSFGTWLSRTNQIATIISTNTVTVSNTLTGGNTYGNGTVIGQLGANIIFVIDGLRGGNVTTSNTLAITSNAAFKYNTSNIVTIVGNTVSTNVNIAVSKINITGNVVAANTIEVPALFIDNMLSNTYINVGSNVAISTSRFFVGNSITNTTITSTGINVANGTLSVFKSATFINTVSVAGVTTHTANIGVTGDIGVTGNVGIGITPTVPLHILSSSGKEAAILVQGSSNTENIKVRTTQSPVFRTEFLNGSLAAPTAVTSGNFLGGYQFGGYGVTSFNRGAQLAGYAAGTWTDTSAPGYLVFQTVASGSITLSDRMRIDSGGNVGIGTTGSPGYKLEIVGGVNDGLHLKDATTATVYGGLFTKSDGLILDTRSAHGLSFATTDNVRMFIDKDGNTGISNTAPTHKFSVNGSSYFGGLLTVIGNTTFTGNTVTVNNFIASNTVTMSNTLNVVGAATLQSDLTVSGAFKSTGVANLVSTLGVVGAANVGGSLRVGGDLIVTGDMAFTMKAGGDFNPKINATYTLGNTDYRWVTYASSVNVSGANSTFQNILFVDTTNSRVGIMNTSPSSPLSVSGNIETTTAFKLPDGSIMTSSSNTTTGVVLQAVDSFTLVGYRSANYTVSIKDNNANAYQISHMLVIHNGTTSYITEFGTMFTNTSLGVFSSDANTTHARLLFTPTSTNTTLKIVKTALVV